MGISFCGLGGLKLWEGSLDLIKTLRLEMECGNLSLVGKKVLELGCGHGLPGIFSCLQVSFLGLFFIISMRGHSRLLYIQERSVHSCLFHRQEIESESLSHLFVWAIQDDGF